MVHGFRPARHGADDTGGSTLTSARAGGSSSLLNLAATKTRKLRQIVACFMSTSSSKAQRFWSWAEWVKSWKWDGSTCRIYSNYLRWFKSMWWRVRLCQIVSDILNDENGVDGLSQLWNPARGFRIPGFQFRCFGALPTNEALHSVGSVENLRHSHIRSDQIRVDRKK